MPKSLAISANGLSFESGLRKMLATPAPTPKGSKKAVKKRKKR
jgi:hypothetical protein